MLAVLRQHHDSTAVSLHCGREQVSVMPRLLAVSYISASSANTGIVRTAQRILESCNATYRTIMAHVVRQ